MTSAGQEIDEVLVARLAELGTGPGPMRGGAVAWSARRLATETATGRASFDPASVEAVVASLREALEEADEVPGSDGAGVGDGGGRAVRGVVGSGFGGLNPAYVLAEVDAAAGEVRVAAWAKEGLIKQRSAAKAVDKVLAALT
ncbi:hypothetical protein H5V45_13585 [Nocardioides sp. KIGAM211]|uniref:Uncharacterized protein n=1 Tax=Nocardioides luti TaxID=2761101 RepID=A0A7X0RHC5_9ACTN|nr:hypothetical protein [Nocardioides luti]MBB6628353.1 hypothetical protein [Nocardioides luti]